MVGLSQAVVPSWPALVEAVQQTAADNPAAVAASGPPACLPKP